MIVRRFLPWLGPLAALAARAPIGETARALAALVALFIGPALAAWPIFGRFDAARRAPIATAALAIVLPQLVLLVAGFSGARLSLLLLILVAALVIAALAATIGRSAVGDTSADEVGNLMPGPGRGPLLAGMAALALVAATAGTPLGPYDDALDHLATIRHVAESGRVEFPGAFYGKDQPASHDIRKGVVHLALAMATRLADVDAAIVWRWSATVLAPLALLAFLALLSTLVPGRTLPLWLALPACLFLATDPTWLLKSAYGGHAGLALVWVVIAGMLAGWGAWPAFLGGVALAGVHAYAPVQALVPLVGFAIIARRRDTNDGPMPPAWRSLGALAFGSFLLEAGRLLVAAPSINPLSSQSMPWLMTGLGPIASPLQLLDWYGLAGVVAAFAVIALALLDRRATSRYLLVTLVAPMLLLLNPLLFGPVANVLGSVANKIALVWSPPLAAILLAAAATRPDALRATRIGAGMGLALVMLAAWPGLTANLDRVLMRAETSPRSLPRAAIDLIERHTPADAVIAADPITSYAIPAMTGRRTIVTLHQHAPPGDGRALERLAAAAALGATCVPLAEAAARCRAEGAGWILIDGTAIPRVDEYGAHREPRNRGEALGRFDPPGTGTVQLVESAGGFRIFKISDGLANATGDTITRTRGEPAANAISASVGGVELRVARLPGNARVDRGAVLEFPAWWRRIGAATSPYLEVQAHLRLEHEQVGEESGPFSKLRRRLIIEPRLHGSLRARGVELPFRGLCPVAEWPADEWLGDNLQIIVPQYIVPGRYKVELSLETVALYPTLTPADLFSDADRYEGPELGWMIVE